ncbi:MAG: tetratricopeptide repeat protein [Proteobacteria bacterium]|nr:tetratricopeptide repeat protein [Pseudomonadota bacterium]
MTKRKIKEEIKKPDIVIRTVTFAIDWIKNNMKACIAGLIIVFVICSSLFGYSVYAKRQDDKMQFMLSQAIQTFGESIASGSVEKMNIAETLFNSILRENHKKIGVIARLYLAKISYMKGKPEEARKLYQEVQGQSNDPVIISISERAIQQIDKK